MFTFIFLQTSPLPPFLKFFKRGIVTDELASVNLAMCPAQQIVLRTRRIFDVIGGYYRYERNAIHWGGYIAKSADSPRHSRH